MGLVFSTMQQSCVNESKKCVPFQIQQDIGKMAASEGTPEFEKLKKQTDQKLEEFYGLTKNERTTRFPFKNYQPIGNDLDSLMKIPDVSKMVPTDLMDFADKKCQEKYQGSAADFRLCCNLEYKNSYEMGEEKAGAFTLVDGNIVIDESIIDANMSKINLMNPSTYASCGKDLKEELNTACGSKTSGRGACALDFCSKKGYTKPADNYDMCKFLGGKDCLEYPPCTIEIDTPTPTVVNDSASSVAPPVPVIAPAPVIAPVKEEDNTMLWVSIGVGGFLLLMFIIIMIIVATRKPSYY